MGRGQGDWDLTSHTESVQPPSLLAWNTAMPSSLLLPVPSVVFSTAAKVRSCYFFTQNAAMFPISRKLKAEVHLWLCVIWTCCLYEWIYLFQLSLHSIHSSHTCLSVCRCGWGGVLETASYAPASILCTCCSCHLACSVLKHLHGSLLASPTAVFSMKPSVIIPFTIKTALCP